jgi:hypothetical protein
VTNRDIPGSDMPDMPWQGHQDVPEGASLAALLAGMELPAGSSAGLLPVADALAALRAGPTSDELSGEAVALAAFRNQIGVPDISQQRARRRRPVFSPAAARAAAVAVAGALCVGGVATAAYTGALPAPVQQLAHAAFGAPPAAGGTRPSTASPSTASPSTASPSTASHAALGPCTAWAHARAHGNAKQKAAAFRSVAAAAGGSAKVASYCATVGTSPSAGPHASGGPTAHPTPHASGGPTAHPTPHASGGPTTHPTPHRPTAHPTGGVTARS